MLMSSVKKSTETTIDSNNIKIKYPEIAKQWNYEKNGDLIPEELKPGSNKKVWWKCEKGHEWKAMVVSRIRGKVGCPYCSGHRVMAGFNDLRTKYPEIAGEWNYEKNGELKPEDVTAGSGKKVWWKCDKGHEWESTITNRVWGNNCPYCSGKKILSGFNDLSTLRPDLLNEWDYEKNDIAPNQIGLGSHIKIWWKCFEGHEWQAPIYNRKKGIGCPYCSNKKVLAGYNDLATLRPELVKEWNYEKNNGLVDGNNTDISTPDKVTLVSGNKVWWKCNKGHEWQATVAHRTSRNDGCPFCYGRYVIKGENDLETLFPDVSKEWNYDKNSPMIPSDVTSKSEKKVWWKCEKGHEWQATVAHRTNEMNGCPYCSGRYAIKGVNDLATTNPELIKEWDFEKNGDLRPDDVLPKSEKKVWWKCDKGHEWKTQVAVRVMGCGCPRCSGAGTSLPEQGIAFYLENICKVEQRVKISGKEIDVFLPEYSIGIEYDGIFFHRASGLQKEIEKNKVLLDNGVSLIRVKESKDNSISDDDKVVIIRYDADAMGTNYEWAIKQLCHSITDISGDTQFGLIDINIQRDILKIRERLRLYYLDNSLAVKNPETAKEWDYEKNGKLTPEMFAAGANIKVWWKCSKGHEWQALICNRSKGIGCPYCSGRKAIRGVNDIQTLFPEVVKEWNTLKNGDLKPFNFSSGSSKKVWWKCDKGHEWQATISDRTKMNRGCPYCFGRKAIIGETDIQTLFPDISSEWHSELNGDLKPLDFTSNSSKKIWWKCKECGYVWEKTIKSNIKRNGECPKCKYKMINAKSKEE